MSYIFKSRPLLFSVLFFILFFGSLTHSDCAVLAYSSTPVPGLFSGGGMVLHLFEDKRIGSVRGILYKKGAAYRFNTQLKGKRLYASTLYSRSDKLVPYRKVGGYLYLEIGAERRKINLEMNIGGNSAAAVLRPVLYARAYSVLSRYGNIYCDGERLVLLLEDKGLGSGHKTEKAGWLSRILKKNVTKMPVIGMFFGPGVWYYFQAEASPERGMWSSSYLHIGGGALDGYLLTATLKAKLEKGRLAFSYKDDMGVHSYTLSFSAHGKPCSRVVTRWTSKRRIPRGNLVEPKNKVKSGKLRPKKEKEKEKEKKSDGQTDPEQGKGVDEPEKELTPSEKNLNFPKNSMDSLEQGLDPTKKGLDPLEKDLEFLEKDLDFLEDEDYE